MSNTSSVLLNILEKERRRGLLYITISVLMGIIVTTILLGITPLENSLLFTALSIFESVLIAGFFLTLYFYLKPFSPVAPAPKGKKKNDVLPHNSDHCQLCLLTLLIVLAISLIMVLAILTGDQVLDLPFAVVFAIVATVVTLTIAATIFKELHLTSEKEALGLPKGTIRAIIALSLIVIFAIMIIFTQSQLAPSWTEFPYNANVTYPNGTIVNYPNGTAVLTHPNEAQKDFSLQTLTTISTLVVAIVGFYFGTRAVEVARGEAPTPSLEITPESPTELNVSINTELDPIRAITTPANENVDFGIDSDVNGEIIRKSKANEFRYKPRADLIEQVKRTGESKKVTLSFWLTNNPKTSALLVVNVTRDTQPAPPPTQTEATLKITDPGETVNIKQGEKRKIVLEATPSEKKIAFKEKDEKVESVEEVQNEKGAFNIKVKGDATPGESIWVKFNLVENTNVEATLKINVQAKEK